MRPMEITGNSTTDERIAGLEDRLRIMDRQVRELLSELLDLKTILTKIPPQAAGFEDQEPETGSSLSDEPAAVVITKGSSFPASAPAEPEMVRIMQPDGTMKMEVRRGSQDQIDSTAGYGGTKKSTLFRNRKKP